MSEWVAVVQEEGDEPIEIPTESDGTILLTSLTAQFPGSTGLKFRNPETNTLRGVRCSENQLFPPHEDGWSSHTYICTRPKIPVVQNQTSKLKDEAALKRKSEQDPDGMSSKNQRVDQLDDYGEHMDESDSGEAGTCDLIVLGLPWKATENDIRDYFESYGPMAMVQLKTKEGGQSKGFAFIKFKDLDVQEKVLLTRHMIQERWCDVKVPESQELKHAKVSSSCKIFVARLSETITADDLKEHFEKFGPVTDVYIPKPFRSFAFVTFQESKVAQSLYGKDHIVKGVSVHLGSAQPRTKGGHDHGGYVQGGARGHHGGGGGGGRGYGYDPWGGNGNQFSRPPPTMQRGYYH